MAEPNCAINVLVQELEPLAACGCTCEAIQPDELRPPRTLVWQFNASDGNDCFPRHRWQFNALASGTAGEGAVHRVLPAYIFDAIDVRADIDIVDRAGRFLFQRNGT